MNADLAMLWERRHRSASADLAEAKARIVTLEARVIDAEAELEDLLTLGDGIEAAKSHLIRRQAATIRDLKGKR